VGVGGVGSGAGFGVCLGFVGAGLAGVARGFAGEDTGTAAGGGEGDAPARAGLGATRTAGGAGATAAFGRPRTGLEARPTGGFCTSGRWITGLSAGRPKASGGGIATTRSGESSAVHQK
jgi:hypothetical protein